MHHGPLDLRAWPDRRGVGEHLCPFIGRLLATPTGASLGALDPGRLSLFDAAGSHIGGGAPTKEMPLHTAFYDTQTAKTGAIAHLHSTHSVALSLLPDTDPDNVLPPLTPYSIMRLGKVKLLPYFQPGDAAISTAIRGLAGRRSAVLLANHGPVVAATDIEVAIYAMEELEETARLALLTRGMTPRLLSDGQVRELVNSFDVEWDSPPASSSAALTGITFGLLAPDTQAVSKHPV